MSKSPSQISGALLSGCLGGRRVGGGRGTSFLKGGVNSGSGWEVVGIAPCVVGAKVGSGLCVTCGLPSVVLGIFGSVSVGGGWVGSSFGGEGELGNA